MVALLTVLIVIVCVLLILVVLVQNSKGGGLASGFSSSNQVMGVQKTTELIEKITWGMAIALLVFSISLSFAIKSSNGIVQKDTELRDKIDNAPAAAPLKNVPEAAGKAAKPLEGGEPAPAKK